MVSALNSRLNSPGSSLGQGTVLCAWARYITLISPVKMFLSSRQNGWSSRQQRQHAGLDAILFVTAKAFSPVQKT